MVQRWMLEDPATGDDWVFPMNPNEMDPPLPEKNITTRTTTAIDGKAILFEGKAEPREWSFSGSLFNSDHYKALREWSEKRNRLWLTDHLGRRFLVYIIAFEPRPAGPGRRVVYAPTAVEEHWKHNYTVRALILDVDEGSI